MVQQIQFAIRLCAFLAIALSNPLPTKAYQSKFGSTDQIEITPLELNKLPFEKDRRFPGKTFVSFSLMFVDAVANHPSTQKSDRRILRNSSESLRQLHDAMPTFQEIANPRDPDPDAQLKRDLKKQFGWKSGVERFSKVRLQKFQNQGKIISLPDQQTAVWKIINELDGKLSNFDQFKKIFLLAIISRTGPVVFFDDAHIANDMGMTPGDVEAFRQTCMKAKQSYEAEIKVAKLKNTNLRKTTGNATKEFHDQERRLRLNAIMTVFSSLPNPVRSKFEQEFKMKIEEFSEILLPLLQKRRIKRDLAGKPMQTFRGIRVYKDPYSSGMK